MEKFVTKACAFLLLAAAALTQAAQAQAVQPRPDAAEGRPRPMVKLSAEGKEALRRCKEMAADSRRLRGSDRLQAIANAASAYDRVAGGFADESAVAAVAAHEAAELWRSHGSLPLAEKDYLLAAQLDPGRYGQRGWLGAADMQRRLARRDEALASYRKAIALDPGKARAQTARLALARLLAAMERLDEAVAAAQVALECAQPGRQTIDAADELALLWIRKGDLDAAARAIDHAERAIEGVDNGDPVVAERLRKAVQLMPSRRALQRAIDKGSDAAGDAARLDAARRR